MKTGNAEKAYPLFLTYRSVIGSASMTMMTCLHANIYINRSY